MSSDSTKFVSLTSVICSIRRIRRQHQAGNRSCANNRSSRPLGTLSELMHSVHVIRGRALRSGIDDGGSKGLPPNTLCLPKICLQVFKSERY